MEAGDGFCGAGINRIEHAVCSICALKKGIDGVKNGYSVK